MNPLTRTVPPLGRDHELRTVRHLLEAARSGHSGGLLVTGAPGAGRTALLEHAGDEARDFTVLRARAAPGEGRLPLAGLHQLLRPALPYLPRLPSIQRETLTRALDTGTPGEAFPLANAALGLFAEVAAESPLLICVDDFHLLDPPSQKAVAFAARRLTHDGAVVLLSAREGDPDRLTGIPVLRLRPLPEDAVLRLLIEAAGAEELAEPVAAALATAAEGNPRAALELLEGTGPGQRSGALALARPPRSRGELTDGFAATLARLPEATRLSLVKIAAEPHGPLPPEPWGSPPGEGNPDPLEPARRAGLIAEEGDRVVFTHPLARSAGYHRASPAERRSAHSALARAHEAAHDTGRAAWHRALAGSAPDERVAAALQEEARRTVERDGHSPASLLHEHAARLTPDPVLRGLRLTDAARSAWLSGDPNRARRVLEHVRSDHADLLRAEIDLRSSVAIDASERLGPTADRLARSDPGAALRVLLQAGEASCLSGDHERFFATAERARTLMAAAPAAGDTNGDATGIDHPWSRLVLDYMTGKAAMFQGRHREGAVLLGRAEDTADLIGDPQALVLGGIAGLLRGDHVRTRALAGRAAAVARRTGALALLPQALEFLTYAEMWFGRLSLAEESAAEGLRTALESGQDNCASHHRGALAFVAAIRGEEDTCREHAGTALAMAGEHDVGLPAGLAAWALALLDLGAGRGAEAAMRLRALARSGPGCGHAAVRLLITPHLVEASVRGGVAVRVQGAVETFASWAEATGQDTARAQVMRCRGLLHEGEEANAYFESALDLHASGYCDFEEARTRLLYGGHLRRSRHPGLAREHLYTAMEVFDRLGAVPWVRQAREELRAARGSTAVREDSGVELLSPQQLRIARHVAGGATNREVAARLFLSTRTVDHHLRNIYSKLGIRSRVELSRLVGQ
ncbi:LuxR family transcriptional regulator [Nocardiopsis metallicus]|uniref:DNA-binding CsgD family transcriptional regulator n=1 Tax=Nocardiopsis metallicus TaxID=179819 RepID=A0A840WCL6_9ACTN|nr:DNA-binding CsgD family transcriptional regulator [Nocardiopsis metallicus]